MSIALTLLEDVRWRGRPVVGDRPLLALADRFAYNRTIPTMAWERMLPPAEEALPGVMAGLQAEYARRRPPGLLGEARQLAERLPA